MKRETGSRKKREFRVQDSGFRIQDLEGGKWLAALVLAVATGCAAPKVAQVADADWVSHSTTARGCYERGDFRRAADAYGRAEQRARALDDADALAISAINRAVCLHVEGEVEEALTGLDEALADPRISAPRRMELTVMGARAKLGLGDFESAKADVEGVLKENPPVEWRAKALLILAGSELGEDHVAGATQALKQLPDKAWERLSPLLRAEYASWRAKIAAQDMRAVDAAGLWDESARFWKQAGRLTEMSMALSQAGWHARKAGNLAEACDRYYRSARSLWAQGDPTEAARVLAAGVACAEELKDEAVAKRMAELFVTFKDGKRLSE
ncbi:MAG: hypothetical protein EOM72_10410 [Opitutae bacterium]|nr:hypothetical protein [Opitutae bacterium]